MYSTDESLIIPNKPSFTKYWFPNSMFKLMDGNRNQIISETRLLPDGVNSIEYQKNNWTIAEKRNKTTNRGGLRISQNCKREIGTHALWYT